MMKALMTAKSANLPNWFIGAGFVRNTVWNIQHGFEPNYDFNDLDLGYFDSNNMSEDDDRMIANALKPSLDTNWEVVNQAYAHKYNNVAPYVSAFDGLAHWIETATCVAATLDDNDDVIIIAPWGVDDLLSLRLRLSPYHKDSTYYSNLFMQRVHNKKWQEKWPKLKMVD